MDEFQQNPVSRTVWPWPAEDGAVARSAAGPGKRKVVIHAAVMLSISVVLFVVFRHRVTGLLVFGLAWVMLLSGLFVPPLFTAIERFGRRLGEGVAAAMAWLLLAPLFVLCFIPGRCILRLRGIDPLRRRFPSGESSCWVSYEQTPRLGNYRKQF